MLLLPSTELQKHMNMLWLKDWLDTSLEPEPGSFPNYELNIIKYKPLKCKASKTKKQNGF
jgi:hypothetical protein